LPFGIGLGLDIVMLFGCDVVSVHLMLWKLHCTIH